jgi:hypothetical protein
MHRLKHFRLKLPLGGGLFSIQDGIAAARKMATLPQPLLCVCKSARRAGAMAVIAIAISKGWNSTEALQYAREHDLTFLGTPSMVDWVTGMYCNNYAIQFALLHCITLLHAALAWSSALWLCALCGVMHHHYVCLHVCTCGHATLYTCATTLCTYWSIYVVNTQSPCDVLSVCAMCVQAVLSTHC